MGKHRDSTHEKIFLRFMQKHKDLARGFVKGDRTKVDNLWKELATELNSHGSLQKETMAWRKVWTDWKAAIKKKVAHNTSGAVDKYVLTTVEDALAQLCGIYTVIESIPDSQEFSYANCMSENMELAKSRSSSVTARKYGNRSRSTSAELEFGNYSPNALIVPMSNPIRRQLQERKPTEVEQTLKLLTEWQLPELHKVFGEHKISISALKHLTDAEICELIPKLGPRAQFRGMLQEWRQQEQLYASNEMHNPDPIGTDSMPSFAITTVDEKNDLTTEATLVQPTLIKAEEIKEEFLSLRSNSVCETIEDDQDDEDVPQYENNIQDMELYRLLQKWKLAHLYAEVSAQKITVPIMKIMHLRHVEKLLANEPLGDLVLFEHHWQIWKDQNNTCDTYGLGKSKYNLQTILIDSHSGRRILSYYEKHQMLHEEQRSLLINTICKYIEADGCNLSQRESAELEREILNMFPTEKLEYYTTKSGIRGRIYNKIANLKRYWRPPCDTENPDEPTINLAAECEAENAIYLMRNNSANDQDLEDNWRRCADYRFEQISAAQSVQEVVEKWPEYKGEHKLKLLDIDFSLKHSKAKSMLKIWQRKCSSLESYLKAKIQNTAASEVLQQLICSANSRDLVLLWAFHYLFPPIEKATAETSTTPKLKKGFTVADSQDSFVIIGSDLADVNNKLEIMKLQQTTIRPYLLVVGRLLKVQEIYIEFDNTRTLIPKFISAADTFFKMFNVLNIEYPEESALFHKFIQSYFYDIPPKENNIEIVTITEELNAWQ